MYLYSKKLNFDSKTDTPEDLLVKLQTKAMKAYADPDPQANAQSLRVQIFNQDHRQRLKCLLQILSTCLIHNKLR